MARGAINGLHRASALAASGSTPVMREVAAPLLLKGVGNLHWEQGDCCFAGSMVACMGYLGEHLTYPFVMGVSGGAFRLLWHPKWCPSNHDLLVLGPEPVGRTFRAIGRDYELVPRTDEPRNKELFRRRISQSLAHGRPLLAHGVAGPECCLIAGYDPATGEVLGRSYFHQSENYFREANWHQQCWGLIVLGQRKPAPTARQILHDVFQWAIDLAQTPQREGRISGLAAYTAWAQALHQDADFPPGDLDVLTYRCAVSNSATLFGLCEARRTAAAFLRQLIRPTPPQPGGAPALTAAETYDQEVSILQQAMLLAPGYFDKEANRLQMADPARRRLLADLLLQARDKDEQAITHLQQALAEIRQAM